MYTGFSLLLWLSLYFFVLPLANSLLSTLSFPFLLPLFFLFLPLSLPSPVDLVSTYFVLSCSTLPELSPPLSLSLSLYFSSFSALCSNYVHFSLSLLRIETISFLLLLFLTHIQFFTYLSNLFATKMIKSVSRSLAAQECSHVPEILQIFLLFGLCRQNIANNNEIPTKQQTRKKKKWAT